MKKVFISEKIKAPYIPILYPNLGVLNMSRTPFVDKALHCIKNPIVEIVNKPKDADYICVPHDWSYVKRYPEYLKKYLEISKVYKKTLIVFATGDNPNIPDIPNSIIFRTSQYSDILKQNEIIIPGYVEDLLFGGEVKFRTKKEKPVVGFCGWADYGSLSRMIKSWLKDTRYGLMYILTFNSKWKTRKQGIVFRKKAIKILSKARSIKTNFIVRSSYSGHVSSIKMSTKQAREEYIQNMYNSDYILAPKGDGNYSLRFYEALSLGRIPVLINTNCVLPLDNIIKYKEFCVFIDHANIKNIGDEMISFHKNLSNEEFEKMQKKARKVFDEYLRIDIFFKYIFNHLEETLEYCENKR